MSSQLQPDANQQGNVEHSLPQSAPSTTDVAASLSKFWDTVRSSAELIVTLRQEVVQVRAQNATLEAELQTAKQQASSLVAVQDRIDELELHNLELSEQVGHFQLEIAKRDEAAKVDQIAAEELDRLRNELSQARVDLCEYELQISTKDAELRRVGEDLALLQAQYEDLVERQSKTTVAELQTLQAVHEQRLSEAQLETAEVRQTMERMKTEKSQLNDDYLMLAEKYQSIELQVEQLNQALATAQTALEDAHNQSHIANEPTSDSSVHELEAMRHRLNELERIALQASETEAHVHGLRDEVESLQEQLSKALEIVELYRAAGLRHVEDPDLRNQMSLFASVPTTEQSRQIVQEQVSGKGLSPEEMDALADRLDNLAGRVAQLLGIS